MEVDYSIVRVVVTLAGVPKSQSSLRTVSLQMPVRRTVDLMEFTFDETPNNAGTIRCAQAIHDYRICLSAQVPN